MMETYPRQSHRLGHANVPLMLSFAIINGKQGERRIGYEEELEVS